MIETLDKLKLPFQEIRMETDHDDFTGEYFEYYRNDEHEIDDYDFKIVFQLYISDDVWIGDIKEFWLGEELVLLKIEEEEFLRNKLQKHYTELWKNLTT